MDIKIVIADDHRLFRLGMAAVLETFENITLVGEAENGMQLIDLLQTTATDMVLLDLNMPIMDGYEVLRVMDKRFRDIKIIVISMFETDSHISEAIEAGAKGYLHKNADPEELEMAIKSVYKNNFYFNDKTNQAMLNRLVKDKKLIPVFDNTKIELSDTELDILKFIAQEKTSEEIADRVFLSKRRVDGIRTDLIKKVGVTNVVGLIMFAIRNKIVQV